MSVPVVLDSSSDNSRRSTKMSPSLDPRLCPRVLVDVEPPHGRTLFTSHVDTVKVVHSYLRARSPNPISVLDQKRSSEACKTCLKPNRVAGCEKIGRRQEELETQGGNMRLDMPDESDLDVADPCGGRCHELCIQHSGWQSASKHKQLTAYVAWVNSQLRKKPGAHLIEDLRHDVRDGVALVDLIQVIAGETLPDIHEAPSNHAQMRENVDKILQFMSTHKVKMHHITTRDIVDGNLKAIMRLILALAAHYKPNSVRHSSQSSRQNITGIAQGAAAALTEARRNATRAGHRYRRRRPKEDMKHSDRRSIAEEQHNSRGGQPNGNDRSELDGASDHSSPVSSQNASPRASLYLSDPSSSMEGLLSVSGAMYRGGVMVTSCESDSAMGDSGYSEICDSLKETHEMLFQLHELLLTGDSSGDAKTLSRGGLEGANPKETIIILKGRLLHAEEVAESLRSDLIKVKRDCLELQGTKAGLQQRLKEQETTLSGLKSEVMTLELEKEKLNSEIETLKKQLGSREQVLSDVKTSNVKQVEDKGRLYGELKTSGVKLMEDKDSVTGKLQKELLQRDQVIHQLQEQISQIENKMMAKQAAELSGDLAGGGVKVRPVEVVRCQVEPSCHDQRLGLLADCLNKLAGQDRTGGVKALDLETAKETILQNRCEALGHSTANATIDQLEDTVVKLLDKLHINGSQSGTSGTPAAAASTRSLASNKNVTTPVRRATTASQAWRTPGCRETPKVAPRGRVQGSSPAVFGSPGRGSLRNSCQNTQPSLARGQQSSPRTPGSAHAAGRGGQGLGKVPRSQIPKPQGTTCKQIRFPPMNISDAQTSVVYYVEQAEKPLSCVISKPLGDIRLRDFKSVIEDSNLYHYFFKVLDPEYGTVKEETRAEYTLATTVEQSSCPAMMMFCPAGKAKS